MPREWCLEFKQPCWDVVISYITVSFTYMRNCPLQPFIQDYGLASHTTHIVCVNFIREWRHLELNVDSEWQFFEKLFHVNFIYSEFFARNLLRGIYLRNLFFYISFRCLTWGTNLGFTSNKPTHYLLDYGDFNSLICCIC